MSQFALTRLIVANNRSAWRRVIGIAAGVMVGVALLLLLLGASQGFEDRSLRSTWKNLMMPDKVHLSVDNADLSDDEAAAALLLDYYLDNAIQGIRVATTESTSIRIPGAEVMPGPGEYLASPALAQLIDAAPDGVLAHRYGVRVGIITHDGLEGPDSLVLVQGTTTAELIAADANLGTTPMVVKEFTGADYTSQAYRTVALIGAIAVLIPVLLLIAIVTDLGAAQRTERFASLRLVGATPQQVAQIGAIEIGVTTAVGALVGVGLYFALIPLAAVLELGTSRFYPSDLFVGIPMIVSVVLLTILCATTVSWWRVRHADIGPLGAAREQQEKRPQLVALLPLLVGLFLLGFGVILRRLDSGDERTTSLAIGGFVLTALGLLWAGPLLTWWAARAGQKSARTATQVIGFSRTSKHPRSAFRAVAGMVIATFAVTVFAVGITSVAGIRDVPIDDERLNPSTLIAPLQAGLTPAEVEIKAAELASRPDVEATAIASFTLDDDLILSAKGGCSAWPRSREHRYGTGIGELRLHRGCPA
ncbi:MAG: FtsX-like permease family protein [Tessaracoccus sp.]